MAKKNTHARRPPLTLKRGGRSERGEYRAQAQRAWTETKALASLTGREIADLAKNAWRRTREGFASIGERNRASA